MFLKYTIYKSKEILIMEEKIIKKYAVSLWYNCKPVLRFLKGFSKNKKKKNGTLLVAQTVKRLSTMRETWVQPLGWEG